MKVLKVVSRLSHLTLIILLIVSGCKRNPSTDKSISNSINGSSHDSKFVKSQTKGDYLFELFFKPSTLMAMQELRNGEYSKMQFDSVQKGFNTMYYFTFSVRSIAGKNDIMKQLIDKYSNKDSIVSYLAFEMQHNFKLVSADLDTIECKLFHFEGNYGTSPFIRFDLGFEKDKSFINETEFIYADQLLDVGIINFPTSNLSGDMALSEFKW